MYACVCVRAGGQSQMLKYKCQIRNFLLLFFPADLSQVSSMESGKYLLNELMNYILLIVYS